MALTTLIWDPSSITRIVKRGGPPSLLRVTVQCDGNESYSDADLTEPNGTSGWLVFPATIDHNTDTELEIDPRMLQAGKYSTTLRATKSAVTADLVVTAHVRVADYVPKRR